MYKDKITKYKFQLSFSQTDDEWVCTCLDFPSLSYISKCIDHSLDGMIDLVERVIDDMFENGEIPPGYTREEFSDHD